MTLFLTEALAVDPGLTEPGSSIPYSGVIEEPPIPMLVFLSEAVLAATLCRCGRCEPLEIG